jgi:ribosome biogenesis protein Nip4
VRDLRIVKGWNNKAEPAATKQPRRPPVSAQMFFGIPAVRGQVRLSVFDRFVLERRCESVVPAV